MHLVCAGTGLPAMRALTNVQIGGDMVGAMRTRKQHPTPSGRVLLADNGFPHTAFAAETAAPAVLLLRRTTHLLCATAANPCVRTSSARHKVKVGYDNDSTSAQINTFNTLPAPATKTPAAKSGRGSRPRRAEMTHVPEFSGTLEILSDTELLERIHRLRMSGTDAYAQDGHDGLEHWVRMAERYAIEARCRGF